MSCTFEAKLAGMSKVRAPAPHGSPHGGPSRRPQP
jgi:hypothetical protein